MQKRRFKEERKKSAMLARRKKKETSQRMLSKRKRQQSHDVRGDRPGCHLTAKFDAPTTKPVVPSILRGAEPLVATAQHRNNSHKENYVS
jgi:hypothetical protein